MRENLQCEVCGTKTLIRIQIGWLDMHPIRFNCGECGILITGALYMNQDNATAYTKFDNVKKIFSDDSSDFYIEASGELLTDKLQKYKFENTLMPPFFKSGIWKMNDDIVEFKRKTLRFLAILKTDWPKYRRVNELWHKKNSHYLKKELKQQITNIRYPLENEAHYLTAIRQLNIRMLSSILSDDFFNGQIAFIRKEMLDLGEYKNGKFKELTEYYSPLLSRYEEKTFEIIKQFMDKFRFLIPVFGLDFYKNNYQTDLKEKGITTVSFEELKNFYVDTYEVIADILDLLIAYNNLKYRDNFQQMKEKRKDVVRLEQFKRKSKGERIEFIDGSEEYDKIVYPHPHLNNKIRNAIGHNTYKIDIQSQYISFYPKGKENDEKPFVISLNEFTRYCWDLFQSLINLSELVYQTRKLDYLNRGIVPSFEPIFDLTNSKEKH